MSLGFPPEPGSQPSKWPWMIIASWNSHLCVVTHTQTLTVPGLVYVTTEFSRHGSMWLARLGCKRLHLLPCSLCLLSFSLTFLTLGETSCHIMRNSKSQWRGPCGKELGSPAKSTWGTKASCQQPPAPSWKHICLQLSLETTAHSLTPTLMRDWARASQLIYCRFLTLRNCEYKYFLFKALRGIHFIQQDD